MAEVKQMLKLAKGAIKDKDYEAAMIHCKDVLKIERNNYTALVMLGRVCQEQRKNIDSKKALLCATKVDSENPVAWQGLLVLHEKDNSVFLKDEEIEMLMHLKKITKENDKLEKIIIQLADVYKRYECYFEAIDVLETYGQTLEKKEDKCKIHKLIIQIILDSSLNSDESLTEKLILSYENILNDLPLSENEANYKSYLLQLSKTKQYKKLIEGAICMHIIFPTSYSLEWIAKSYVELKNNKDNVSLSDFEIKEYINKLLLLHSASPWGNLAKGILYMNEEDYSKAKVHLRKGCESLNTNIEAWMVLLKCLEQGSDYAGIDNVVKKLINIIKTKDSIAIPKTVSSLDSLTHSLQLTHANALLNLGQTNHVLKAIEILREIPDKSLNDSMMLIKALIKLKKPSEASKELESFQTKYGDSVSTLELKGSIARCSGDIDSAKSIYEDLLQEAPSNDEIMVNLGQIYFDAEEYEKCFVLWLKAAKINPKNSWAFLYLGHYFKMEEKFDRARKCYEKAFNLNPFDDDIGASLSDIYRITEDHEANVSLLIKVTDNTGRSGGGWAWLRLGLHYCSHSNADRAVQCLQCAIEINSNDRTSYECLGDAYLLRGSYTAALKVFTKAIELDPKEAIYSKCKIAHINCLIGNHLLSIAEYEDVIVSKPPSAVETVALVGLAQVLITRAKKYQEEILFENLREDCLRAINCLTRVAERNGSNLTVWKLLGDACILQASISPTHSTFSVPKRLIDSSETSLVAVVDMNKEELLSLGTRCYGVGLHISDQSASLWHDLGVSLFLQNFIHFKITKGTKFTAEADDSFNQENNFLERATKALKKSLSLESNSHNTWNYLGVVSYFRGDMAFAQNCFIRSLLCQPTVEGWTHLGTLYLKHQKVYLAHEAFSQAQALDPNYVACWVGQAMVADAVGHYEAFDLYRHSTLLGVHPESCLGFAQKFLLNVTTNLTEANTKMSNTLLPNVTDCLQMYSREKDVDVVGLNMCGMALEMMGLKETALQMYEKAIKVFKEEVVPSALQDTILFNYSRLLSSLGQFEKATFYFSQMEETDFHSQSSLALTKLKANEFDEAYQKYSEALAWLASDDDQKAYVLVALAFLQYKYNNIEEVKTLLFQSSTVVQGLLALTSLGLLQGDDTLTSAAITELEPFVDSKENVHHVAFMKATQASLQGDYHKAKIILSRAIHRHPENAALWRNLSHQLLSIEDVQSSAVMKRIATGAKNAAASATALAQAAKDNKYVDQDLVMKVLSYLKASRVSARKSKLKNSVIDDSQSLLKAKSLKEAQRAVLMCPQEPKTWAVMIAAMGPSKQAKGLANLWSNTENQNLKSWFKMQITA